MRGLVAFLLLSLAVATACTDEPAPKPPTDAAFPMPGDLPPQGLDAGAEGVLRFTADNCPYLEGPTGEVTKLNFPAETVVGHRDADGTRSVVGVDGRVWGIEGRWVDFGGGGPMDWRTFVDCGAPSSAHDSLFIAENYNREFRVQTSGWTENDDAMGALASGTLRFTARGCPYLGIRGRLYLAFPKGARGITLATGVRAVVDPDGYLYGTEGHRVSLGGGVGPAAGLAHRCSRGPVETFHVQQRPSDKRIPE